MTILFSLIFWFARVTLPPMSEFLPITSGPATHNGSIGINHDIVLHGRMPFAFAFSQLVNIFHGKQPGPQHGSLIHPYVFPDFGRFPDDDTRAMVNKKRISYFGTGMNINAGFGMAVFG